ncbi:hypothetical protein GGQ74_000325 [Desulfobaculum xiamenense]|uniref:Uncharacterized protein n=1 Tax=Desulfobaculum xiamenense TaxID=995050 RepID=A0A846QMN2_9BACT|nr:hypothetical protein [Desulfobaculum xiamenense]
MGRPQTQLDKMDWRAMTGEEVAELLFRAKRRHGL